MSRELGRRIERHVVDTVEKGGLELLPESDSVNDTGGLNFSYRVVPRGGMVPFASVGAHVGYDKVTVGIDAIPFEHGKGSSLGYFILVPGTVPTKEQDQYGYLTDPWAESPERLAELVLGKLRELAPAGTLPF